MQVGEAKPDLWLSLDLSPLSGGVVRRALLEGGVVLLNETHPPFRSFPNKCGRLARLDLANQGTPSRFHDHRPLPVFSPTAGWGGFTLLRGLYSLT